jgi:hypothetical protein
MVIILNSVGCVFNDETEKVHPIYQDGSYDANDNVNGMLLSECDEEWFEALDEADTKVVAFYLWLLYKRGAIFNVLNDK